MTELDANTIDIQLSLLSTGMSQLRSCDVKSGLQHNGPTNIAMGDRSIRELLEFTTEAFPSIKNQSESHTTYGALPISLYRPNCKLQNLPSILPKPHAIASSVLIHPGLSSSAVRCTIAICAIRLSSLSQNVFQHPGTGHAQSGSFPFCRYPPPPPPS